MTNEFIVNTPEYKRVLEVISLLKKQQQIALQDIQTLRAEKNSSIENPEQWVKEIYYKKRKLPQRQSIVPVPYVSMDRFLSRSALNYSQDTSISIKMESTSEISSLSGIPKLVKEIKTEPGLVPPIPVEMHLQPNSKASELNATPSQSLNSGKVGIVSRNVPSLISPPVQLSNSMNSLLNGRKPNGKDKLIPISKEKSASFNRPWSEEEQRKLEHLLVVYPEEEISAKRWNKIAAELPNRTHKQVASRVQKYFQKLEKLGKPIPGKLTSSDAEKKKPLEKAKSATPIKSNPLPTQHTNINNNNNNNNHSNGINASTNNNNNNGVLQPISKRRKAQIAMEEGKYYTKPPVMMSDDDSDDDDLEDDEELKQLEQSFDHEQKNTEEYKELVALVKEARRAKRTKKNERVIDKSELQPEHIGYKCDSCSVEPIMGNLFTCSECPKNDVVDLCETCYTKGEFENEIHKKVHKFNKIARPEDQPWFLSYNYEYKGSAEERYLTPTFLG